MSADETLGWCVLELMGHRRLAGYLSQQDVASTAMLRIDVPCDPPTTQYYSGSAVYCITPTTEDIARHLAKRVPAAPVQRWELPAAPADRDEDPGLTNPAGEDDDDRQPF